MPAPQLRAPILPPPQAPRRRKRRRSMTLGLLGILFTTGMVLFVTGSAVAGYVLWKVSKDLPDYCLLYTSPSPRD